MVDISTETWNKAEVSVITLHENDDVNKTVLLLLCISDAETRWSGKNLYDLIDKKNKEKCRVTNMIDLTKQQISKYKIDRARLFKGGKNSMYVHEDILIPIIMQSRLSNPKTIKFRSDLGFNQINLILKKEQSVIESIRDTFKGEDIRIQYTVLGYRIDLYFYEHKLAIEIDELGHNDRNTDYEIKRQREIEKELNCIFIRTNPDAADFNINKLNNQIFKHIQSKGKNAVNKLINKIAEDFKKIVAVTKLKELKRYAKNILPNYKK